MAPRDYKQRPRRAAPRSPARRRAGVSGWVLFASGACVGAVATAALFLYEPSAPQRVTGASANAPQATTKAPRFEFYTLLPDKEIAIPETSLPQQSNAGNAAATRPPPGARYLLQVGSFRRLEDADRLKARLAFLGLEAAIQTVSIDGDETWHRVRLGPFEQVAELREARERLRENAFEPLVMKLK